MKLTTAGIYIMTGAIFLAVGVGAALAWHKFFPLVTGAAFVGLGVVGLVYEKRRGRQR